LTFTQWIYKKNPASLIIKINAFLKDQKWRELLSGVMFTSI